MSKRERDEWIDKSSILRIITYGYGFNHLKLIQQFSFCGTVDQLELNVAEVMLRSEAMIRYCRVSIFPLREDQLMFTNPFLKRPGRLTIDTALLWGRNPVCQ